MSGASEGYQQLETLGESAKQHLSLGSEGCYSLHDAWGGRESG